MPKRNGGGGGGGQAAKVREDPLYAQVRQLKQQKNQAKKAQYKKYAPRFNLIFIFPILLSMTNVEPNL